MPDKTLKDLLIHALKDIYFAESAIYKALPKMIEAAQDEDLKQGLEEHHEDTEEHIERLESIFALLDIKAEAEPCEAIKGVLKEADELLSEFGKSSAADAAIIFACQAVEHYEITRYGSMHAWAEQLELFDIAELLADTLNEEYAADDLLTMIAEGGVNEEAEDDEDEEAPSPKSQAAKSKGGKQQAAKSSPDNVKSSPDNAKPKKTAAPKSTPAKKASPTKKSEK